jgi:hypothetical protein
VRKIYIVAGAVLLLVGILFINIIDIAAGTATLLVAAQGIGSMRTFGRAAGAFFAALGAAGFARLDLFGLLPLTPSGNVLHVAAALVFLYVGLLAPPRL